MNYTEKEIDKALEFFWENIIPTASVNVIGLSGNLGAGKTTFTKHLLKSLGVTQNVVSPTFVLRRDYSIPSPSLPFREGDSAQVRGFLTGGLKNFDSLHKFAINMKKNPTKAEELLWENLRRNKFGSRFRRQHVVDNFIADFINIKNNLIIEVDGEVHNHLRERDDERTKVFNNLGFKVLRFTNEQVLKDTENVLGEIGKNLKMVEAEEVLPEGEDLGGDDKVGFTKIIHIDAYRLEKPEQIYQVVSKEELADKNNLILIEWPELSENIFDKVFLFEHVDEETRKISLKVL